MIMSRTIHSFVRRASRLTSGQSTALNKGWDLHGVEPIENQPLDLEALFGRKNPKVLEIGFGMGQSLAKMAETQPEEDFLGIEVHKPGIGAILVLIEGAQLKNLKLIEGDAVEILECFIPDQSLDKIQIFFPDPWPKRRHHKRRLIQPEFLRLLCTKLKKGALLHLATDWEHYADQMMEVLSQESSLLNTAGPGIYAIHTGRPLTKFEKRGQGLGHGIWDLLFKKV